MSAKAGWEWKCHHGLTLSRHVQTVQRAKVLPTSHHKPLGTRYSDNHIQPHGNTRPLEGITLQLANQGEESMYIKIPSKSESYYLMGWIVAFITERTDTVPARNGVPFSYLGCSLSNVQIQYLLGRETKENLKKKIPVLNFFCF